jgi:hypothetical protein
MWGCGLKLSQRNGTLKTSDSHVACIVTFGGDRANIVHFL